MRNLLAVAMLAAVASTPPAYAASRGDVRWRKGSDCQLSKRAKSRAEKKRRKLRRKQGRA